jgi:CubicO group peptidase (beta-lactamase class C family)
MILNVGELDGRRYFDTKTVQEMRTNQLSSIGKTAGLGWEISRPDVMGNAQRDGMMMKTGFTGCWIALDPAGSRALVHLSNRTYPQRGEREPIQAFWRGLNEAFFS